MADIIAVGIDKETGQGKIAQSGDFVDCKKAVIIESPDGHRWKITVSNLGIISTLDLGV